MYCRNCGEQVDDGVAVCLKCGAPPSKGKKYCPNCGEPTEEIQVVCVKCGVRLAGSTAKSDASGKKIAAGILGILLGWLGIHKFYLGYTKEGVIMLLVSLVIGTLTCGIGISVMSIIGLIEGIIYLTKSDEEFNEVYIQGKKGWF